MKRRKKTASPNPYLIRPRIYLNADLIVGPGKVELLKAVRDTGSISAAARQLGMNYKRAWYLLDTLNKGFHQPVIEAAQGGRGGEARASPRLVKHSLPTIPLLKRPALPQPNTS